VVGCVFAKLRKKMKHILAIVLAGLTVQAGFASEATNAIAESGHPDVSIEVFVQSTGSSREKVDQDPSFFATGSRRLHEDFYGNVRMSGFRDCVRGFAGKASLDR
jgi:hypothetical protein